MARTISIAAASAVAFIGLSITSPPVAGSSSLISVDKVLPILAEPARPSDQAPPELDLEALGGIVEGSVRAIGNDELAQYWVGKARGADVCLIVNFKADEEMAASTCAPITTFYQNGLSLVAGKSLDDPSSLIEAYLLPDDITAPPSMAHPAPANSDRVDDERVNLISGRPSTIEIRVFEQRRSDGSVFRFAPISLDE